MPSLDSTTMVCVKVHLNMAWNRTSYTKYRELLSQKMPDRLRKIKAIGVISSQIEKWFASRPVNLLQFHFRFFFCFTLLRAFFRWLWLDDRDRWRFFERLRERDRFWCRDRDFDEDESLDLRRCLDLDRDRRWFDECVLLICLSELCSRCTRPSRSPLRFLSAIWLLLSSFVPFGGLSDHLQFVPLGPDGALKPPSSSWPNALSFLGNKKETHIDDYLGCKYDRS